MASYTIANQQIVASALLSAYAQAKLRHSLSDATDLDVIFKVALQNPDRFPGISINGVQNQLTYIDRWVKGDCEAQANRPSQRTAPPKSACTDPAIAIIVQGTQGYSDSETKAGEENHNLFMSAENIQGNLLEEYIAQKVRPYGFIWCEGNVLRAIDFCNTDGSLFLQIKNKSNTENSSSSNIREGTSIEKWYRLGTRTQAGKRLPDYKWHILNNFINQNRTEGRYLPPCTMNEPDYQSFLKRVAIANHNLISRL